MRSSGAFLGVALKRAVAVAPLAWLGLSAGVAHGQQAANPAAARPLDALVKEYCIRCHNAEDWAGSLALDTMDLGHVGAEPVVWEKTIGKLRGRLMPPAGEKQPSQSDVDAVVRFLETSIDKDTNGHHVGHVPIQRLNRDEFASSVKALIGVDINARQALPTEIEVHGFSNIAEALAMSPAFLEQYMSAARRAVRLAIGEPVPKMAKVFVTASVGKPIAYPLGTRATAGGARGAGMSFTYVFPADGEYRFNVTEEDYIDIGLYPRGAENPATMVILVDGVEGGRKEIGGGEWLDIADRDGGEGKKKILAMVSTPVKVKAGRREVAISFIDRSQALSNSAAGGGGGFGGGGRVNTMPIIQTGIEIEGPFNPTGLSMNDSRARIFVCQPQKQAEERPCAEKIARHVGTQAFRRPVTDADLQYLMKFYEMGRAEPGAFDAGVTEMVTAILSSPDFLYRAIPAPAKAGETRLLTDLELASRLSFMMWNSGPDQELLDLAAARRLSDTRTLNAQVARMLKDPRANALVEKFALGWLNLDELEKVEPTTQGWNAGMRANFETEIRMFLASVLLENRSVVDLLTADWTFVNQDLARHYGITGVRGSIFKRVTLSNPNRFGLLGKGAVLLRTSYADRTSPVLRGSWVLEKILGTPPTPPPPGVETNLSVREGEVATTIRSRLEAHRENRTCMGCHGIIDPPGLALENFDNTGQWRETDAAARTPIDATTVLSSGIKLNGPVDLRTSLLSRQDQFPTTVTRSLMMFALNREVEELDMPEVRRIVREAAASNYSFGALIEGIVNSDAFRRQSAEEHKQGTVAAATASAAATRRP